MSVIKLHPKFVLRIEKDAAYGIQGDNQEKIKIMNTREILNLYLASLGKYNFSFPSLKDWGDRGIIVKDNAAGQILNEKNEKENLRKIMDDQPAEYTQYPLMLTLGITNRCPFYCRHCGNHSGPKSKIEMDFSRIKNIISQCREMGVLKITFTGGEPFIRKDIFKIISCAKKAIPRVSVTSNGKFINEAVAEKLAATNVSMVKISLDGLQEFHDHHRRYAGAYDGAIKAIRYLKNKGIEVRAQSTLMKNNRWDLLNLTKVLRGLGVDVHTVVPLSPIGRASLNNMLSPEEYHRFLKEFVKKVKSLKSGTIYQIRPVFNAHISHTLKTLSTKYRCEALKNTLEIQANGNIIPCSFFNLKLGNVYRDKISDVWIGQKTDLARRCFRPE